MNLIKLKPSKSKITMFFTLVILIILCAYFPAALGRSAQGISTAIVVGVGIDKNKEDEGYHISLQIVVPDTSTKNNEICSLIETSGATIMNALNNISYKLGKKVGLEHCGIVVLGSSLAGEDMLSTMDYFYRSGKLALNTTLVEYDGEAQQLLQKTCELNNASSGSIQNNAHYNKEYFGTSKTSTLGVFWNQYFKKGGACIVSEIKKEPATESGGESGEENGAGSESSTKLPLIENKGSSVIYKKGRRIIAASNSINRGFNRLDRHIKKGIDEINDLAQNPFKNAAMTLEIKNTRLHLKRRIENGRFITSATLKIYCRPIEVVDSMQTLDASASLNDYLTNEVKEKLTQKIKNEVAASLDFCKQNNVDVFGLEDGFYRYKNAAYKKYIKPLPKDEFLQNCDIEIKVKVYPYK